MPSTGSESSQKEIMNDDGLTPLQKHALFFDRNKDGLIYPSETYQGLRAIGASVVVSLGVAAFIHGILGFQTRTGILPSPLLPIYIKNIKKGKHGSDTGVYDSEGRFVPSKFEEIFQKNAKTHQNALTSDELMQMLRANRESKDLQGWISALGEWKLLYALFKNKDGLIDKDTIRGVYDGSLFENKEKELRASNSAKKN